MENCFAVIPFWLLDDYNYWHMPTIVLKFGWEHKEISIESDIITEWMEKFSVKWVAHHYCQIVRMEMAWLPTLMISGIFDLLYEPMNYRILL